MNASSPSIAYLLRIELKGFKPAIYREVLVDPDVTLRKLHAIVQAAMGWDNAHAYGFALPRRAGDVYWRIPASLRWEPQSAESWAPRAHSDSRARVADVLTAPRQKLLYMYDFGDEWLHAITLKDIVQTELPLPYLLKAQQGCPPEDCGGPAGASYWSQAWFDPQHEDHAAARELLWGDEAPGTLHFDALQHAVSRLRPKGAKAAAKTKGGIRPS